MTEELKAVTHFILYLSLRSHSKTQTKGWVYVPVASTSPLRKTPVHKLYSSVLGRQLQSGGPTKGPPVLSQLPQGFHHLYTHIEYECASQFYQHSGSSRRTCLKTGKWSGRHVSCSPGEGSRGPQVVLPLEITSSLSQNKHTDAHFNTVIYLRISTVICGYKVIMWSLRHGVFTDIYLMRQY